MEMNETLCKRFREEQERLAAQLTLADSFDISALKTAAGVDLAYWKES